MRISIFLVLTFSILSAELSASDNIPDTINILDGFAKYGEEFGEKFIVRNFTFINTSGIEYAPTITGGGDIIIFISNRPGSINSDEKHGSIPTHDFWSAPVVFDPDRVFDPEKDKVYTFENINTNINEGAPSLSPDGKHLYFTSCNKPDGYGACDIYVSDLDRGIWSAGYPLCCDINTEFWESAPGVSPDADRIYFTSTRKGPNSDGKFDGNYADKMDIWYSDRTPGSDSWEAAINMSEINTEGMEAYPFIAPDGKTIFFSSNELSPNYGGLDLYFSRFDDKTGKWSEPVNLGEPINSEGNESFVTIPENGNILFFSSDRKDIEGHKGNLDIYYATLNDNFVQQHGKVHPICFKRKTTLFLELEKKSVVSVLIRNEQDETISELFNGDLEAGKHEIEWKGTDIKGKYLRNGAYFFTIMIDDGEKSYTEKRTAVIVGRKR